MTAVIRNPVDELNRCMPAAAKVGLGDTLSDIIQSLNGINAAPEALVTYIDSLAGMIDELATRFDTLSTTVNSIAAAANTLATRLDTTNTAVKGLGTKLDLDEGVTDTNYAATVTGSLVTNIQAGLNMDEVSVVTDTQADLNADAVDAAGTVTLDEVTPVLTLDERAAAHS